MQDLAQLSDYDFEQVIADLLSAEWHVRVEYFPKGRDSGVDLRVLGPVPAPLNLPPQGELVVQCKHMPGATITQLRSLLRAEASKKIVGEAYKYVLVTSARLTRANKQEIALIFGGRLPETDILGRDDIDSLLRRHPAVVRANMKLWLASGTALQAFLNQVEELRSNVLKTELEKLRPRFVQTSVVTEAQHMLGRLGVCILAGAPGVGKTTTAKILLLRYLSEGWQPVVAIADIRELEAQLLPEVKQILFFDDFLGVTTLPTKLAKGDDSGLLRLIHLIENDPTKVFVLTTRDYILRQAQQTYEKLNDEVFNVAKLVIDLGSITVTERAHILYNQLFFSPLRSAAAAAPDGPRRYMALTGHHNYNPRLIEAAIAAAGRDLNAYSRRLAGAEYPTDSGQHNENRDYDGWADVSDGESPNVPALLQRALDHPEKLWEHVLLHQLTQLQREILISRLSLGSEVVEIADFLRLAYNFANASGDNPKHFALDMALKVLDGDLLSVSMPFMKANQLLVNRLHPGVADSLIALLQRYPEYLQALIASASSFEQVRWLAEFFGVVSFQRSRRRRVSVEYSIGLVQCAERNLVAPPIARDHGILSWKSREFSDIGKRLEVLSAIYTGANRRSTTDFADQIVPQFLAAIQKVPGKELVRVLRALQAHVFSEWRWRRTEINVAVLGQLDDPDDTDEWSLLRDALDLVETTEEYREDLKERFAEFLERSTMDAYDIIEEAAEDNDVDIPLDDLSELDDLADRWGVSSTDIDYVVDELREIQTRRDEVEAEERRQKRTQNQPTLFETTETEPGRGGSIFDHL